MNHHAWKAVERDDVKRPGRSTGLWLAALTLAIAPLPFAPAALAQDANRQVVPPQLIERWWQWRVALPELASPSSDPSGRFCDAGQQGDTWFLAAALAAGSGSQPLQRQCRIPRGWRVFFPILTVAKFTANATEDAGCEKAKAAAAEQVESATEFFASLDGAPLIHPENRRAATASCFPLAAAPSASAGGPRFAAADGYWLLLDPLPPGDHELIYGTRYKEGSRYAGSVQLMTYKLVVR